MNKENTQRLCWRFPLLYRGRTKSIQENLMAFGFEHADGWYDIIYRLSEKLEALIKKQQQENPETDCVQCGCKKEKHHGSKSYRPGKCLAIKRWPTKRLFNMYECKKWMPMWLYKAVKRPVYGALDFLCRMIFWELRTCHCDGYEPAIGLAVQVKEKFGTLRFYMHYSTEEMEELIRQAEKETETTCEDCGTKENVKSTTEWSGNEYAWIRMNCHDCYKKTDERRKEDWDGKKKKKTKKKDK